MWYNNNRVPSILYVLVHWSIDDWGFPNHVIGVSVDNEVISLENDMMDIHRTIIVMQLIHKSLRYNNYETK